MDSWKYLSEGRVGLLSEELDFPIDGGSCKSKVMGCEIKPLFNFENFPLVSNTQALERLDLGFSDEIRSSYSLSSEPSGEVFSDEIGADSYGNVPFCEERELGSQISTDFIKSNNQDCSLFDLKLGRLTDGGSANESELSKANGYAPSSLLSLPSKRARLMALNPRPPCCQVLGCNEDLSSCKGYYKRHKVCDVHTKTAIVIVDGMEQRFCQQCSRFHLLNEFDDGKRSCRRRLAAHNKRRRKPQLTSESVLKEPSSNMLQLAGTGIIGFSSPFAFPGGVSSLLTHSGEKMYNESAAAGGVVKDTIVDMPTSKTPNLSGILQTRRALSLLSAQSSHKISSCGQLLGHSTRIGFHTPQMPSMEAQKAEPTSSAMNLHNGITIDLRRCTSDAISLGPQPQPQPQPGLEKTNNCHPLGQGIILDLLQLSSHLQRIEQQRHLTETDAG